jgi:cupin superfamily acireductone dioxygenase involved in methionine salvage
MSTRWQIAAKLSNGEAGCIYVHSDGYPSYAFATLQQHYTDQAKVDRLIALGDCLSVGKEIEDCDTFSSRHGEDWDDIKPTFAATAKEAADKHLHGDEEYRYFWDGQQWTQAEF